MIDTAKLALVADLRGYDHAFLNAAGVKRFAEGFGVELHAYKHTANPTEPKGLVLEGGAKSAVGMDAAELAESVCRSLNVEYVPKMGRGSRLRSCCDALEAFYSQPLTQAKSDADKIAGYHPEQSAAERKSRTEK